MSKKDENFRAKLFCSLAWSLGLCIIMGKQPLLSEGPHLSTKQVCFSNFAKGHHMIIHANLAKSVH